MYAFNDHIEGLLTKYLRNELSDVEAAALRSWVEQSPSNRRTFEKFSSEASVEQALKKMQSYIDEQDSSWQVVQSSIDATPQRSKVRSLATKWAVAASIAALLILTGIYFFQRDQQPDQPAIAKIIDVPAPQTNKAMIQLADGRSVYLDSAINGQLALQGNVKVVKLANGQIAYQTMTGESVTELKYNTLSNPRGSNVIDMQLSDGSHVWLNAGSSITYPVAFIGNERNVSINGEAYFEVAHNSAMPFKVSKGDMRVTVLGTHFNVNAYDDDELIKVTLLEGSVTVNNVKIKPTEQGVVAGDQVSVAKNIDIDAVIAWKNGFFAFTDIDLKAMLKQAARWYDIDVTVLPGTPAVSFSGKVGRQLSLLQFLDILDQNRIRYRIEARKLTILPKN